jgi:hypothetical protein
VERSETVEYKRGREIGFCSECIREKRMLVSDTLKKPVICTGCSEIVGFVIGQSGVWSLRSGMLPKHLGNRGIHMAYA